MWSHFWSILALALLCALWVLFQRWLQRLDPDGRRIEDAGGCGGRCSTGNRTCRAGRPHDERQIDCAGPVGEHRR